MRKGSRRGRGAGDEEWAVSMNPMGIFNRLFNRTANISSGPMTDEE
jgi:hypothetical protein